MLNMKEKIVLVVLVSTLTAVLTVGLIHAKFTYEVELVSSPNGSIVYAPAGQPFNISCQVVGGDARYVSAMKWLGPRGNDIGEGNPGVIKSANNLLYLTFSDPKSDDRGVYKCAVKYGNKYDLQYAVNIVFYGPAPEFEPDFEDVEYTEGDRAQLHCYALGERPMTYVWYDELTNLIETNKSISISIDTSFNESFLVIENVQKSDEGIYTCDAKNSHGLSSKLFNLAVRPRSGDNGTLVTNVKVMYVGSTSVSFEIIVEGSAEYIVVSYKEIRSDKEDRRQLNMNVWFNIYTIDNLVPSGKYTFRFGVRNSNDTKWSKEYEVTLLPDAPEIIIRRQEVGILEFEWFVPVDDRMRGTIDKYEISYYMLTMKSGKFIPMDCVTTIQIPSCRGSSYIIAGLSSGIYYQIEVRAHTASGYGEPSKQKFILPK